MTAALPCAANSGPYRLTGGSYAGTPRSAGICTVVTAMPLLEKTVKRMAPSTARLLADQFAVEVGGDLESALRATRHTLVEQCLHAPLRIGHHYSVPVLQEPSCAALRGMRLSAVYVRTMYPAARR